MYEIYKWEFNRLIDIKVDLNKYHEESINVIQMGIDSGELDPDDWQPQLDKLSKMGTIRLPDRQLLFR